MKKSYFTLLFTLSVFCGMAQSKSYKKGISLFQSGLYEQSIKEFNKVKDPAINTMVQQYTADAFRLSNRYLEALPLYAILCNGAGLNADNLFHYAYALKANQEYANARTNFEKYLGLKPTNKTYVERANRELNTLLTLEEINNNKKEIQFENFKEINTKGLEFSPILKDDYLIYSASMKDKMYANGQRYVGLYKVKVDKDLSAVGKAEIFDSKIFDIDRNEASPTFTPDGKIMVFARGNTGKRKDKSANVDLYLSRFVPAEGWTEPKLVSVSDSLYWDGSPAFSRDGKSLYFSSNRPGGSGGLDLYRVNMDASGRFGSATNMGKVINTAADEMFPFVAEDGKLYFASDGHPGLGKLDLFVAVRSGGKISVENMGLPFNSSMDDFSLSTDSKGNILYCSNRAGGQGDDDIYIYRAPQVETEPDPNNDPLKNKKDSSLLAQKIVNYYLEGTVSSKSKAIDSALVKIFKVDGGLEEILFEAYAPQGKFGPFKLEEDTDYSILVEKVNFLNKREDFSMFGRKIPSALLKKPVTDTTFYNNIELDNIFLGKTFKLENIYYDLDKFDIRADAALELDKLFQILKDNPSLKIELGSHTDSRGSELYNERLSQKRADAVISYLATKGISNSRLEARGYGESELINLYAKTEEEHQINRRTEFKVIQILK